ncbi:hypothetical protein ADIAG_03463 [Paeniglutamicibacter gangotriensis Lz1y]|uniref:Uncharacterized protein n=1 Tax=Paeniglutamicibacter gangotriensis Lz1y TaxID=1276920 RepID=M7MQJ5_9MICC|nr:hypothetical protein ADIAG_03463 [Paeniglutamicibacter gangotriensis Lz1y]
MHVFSNFFPWIDSVPCPGAFTMFCPPLMAFAQGFADPGASSQQGIVPEARPCKHEPDGRAQ